jgi:hypothetical protein
MTAHSRWILLSLAATIVIQGYPAANAPAQQRGGASPPVVRIVACVVYPEGDPKQRVDCTQQANATCGGRPVCELPIGLALTGGRELGDAHTWKKVRVRYRCGDVEKVDGPHNQSEHATMLLRCIGGF